MSDQGDRVPMTAESVLELYQMLDDHGVHVWLDGGWGVDALLEEQTRSHKDLDVVVGIQHLEQMKRVLEAHGFEFAYGTEANFVLRDERGREIDVHVAQFDAHGNGIYRMQNGEDWIYPAEGFTGRGRIAGAEVRCLTPAVQMLCHTGYELGEKDFREMELLHARFGVDYPESYAHSRNRRS